MQNSQTDNKKIYDNVIYSFSADWQSKDFESVLVNNLPKYKKYKRKEILPSGKIPVIDQGSEVIAGYINDIAGKYSGDLPLVIFGDHTRNVKYVDYDFAVGADGTKLLKTKSELIEKFFYYYLKSVFIPPSGYSRHYKYLKEIQVPIPDKLIQLKIIENLDSLLPKIQSQTGKLVKARILIKKFRQAILSAAISGQLTEEWRERNNISIEDWHETELGKVIDSFQNGLAKRNSNEGEDTVVIRLADIINFKISQASFREIKLSPQEKEKYKLEDNDILIIRVNGSAQIVGNFILVGDKNEWAYCDHFIRIKCNKLLFPPYLVYLTRTNEVRNYINQNMVSSAGQNTVNQEMVKKIEIVLPSVDEQKEIVGKVNHYFDIADKVKKQIEKAEACVSKLTQAVLAKTFSEE